MEPQVPGHVCRQENNAITKRMMFAEPKKNLWGKLAKEIGIDRNQLFENDSKLINLPGLL